MMNFPELQSHPEGGSFSEVFRSVHNVSTDSGKKRSALTHIYFSLKPGEVSKFHRVESDEVWNFYLGNGIRILQWDGVSATVEEIILSTDSMNFCHVVPAGHWQAAESLEGRTLVGCSVGPGFEFEDFSLIDPISKEAAALTNISGDLRRFI